MQMKGLPKNSTAEALHSAVRNDNALARAVKGKPECRLLSTLAGEVGSVLFESGSALRAVKGRQQEIHNSVQVTKYFGYHLQFSNGLFGFLFLLYILF